jgi:hypothetical protein
MHAEYRASASIHAAKCQESRFTQAQRTTVPFARGEESKRGKEVASIMVI